MSDYLTFILLTAAMGLSIFLSLPIVLSKRTQGGWMVFLNAAAIGILVFLLADIFSDVAPILAPSCSQCAYLTVPSYDVIFGVGVAVAFLILYFIDNRAPAIAVAEGQDAAPEPYNASRLALIIALGIGFQNLTEGLVFGNTWQAGEIGLLAVIFTGFFLQNVTEGFPIGAPFMGQKDRNVGMIVVYFLIGGLPTIIGGVIGYSFPASDPLTVFFDAIAIGAIAYVILPMIKVALRRENTAMASFTKARLVYFGVLFGFLLGFAVNAF